MHEEKTREEFKCKNCTENWSKGYCSICGALICDECSKYVGYARICLECFNSVLEDKKEIRKLKEYLRTHEKTSKKVFKCVHQVATSESRTEKETYLRIGFDDIDSPYGSCTTYVGALLSEKLGDSVQFLDYPHLVRFNPNIPMKTRGNAGIAFHLKVNRAKLDPVKEIVLKTIQTSAQSAFPTTESAVVFFVNDNEKIPFQFRETYARTVKDLLTYDEVLELFKDLPFGTMEVYSHTKSPQGAIGALAAIGAGLNDYTFELLAYRDPSLQKSDRRVSKKTLKNIDQIFNEVTFDNLDEGRPLITPHGPDPVLFGLRGDFPLPLLKAFNLLEHEPIERWMLYKTNQATNAHIMEIDQLSEAEVYQTVRVSTWVKAEPTIQEGNVILSLTDGSTRCKALLYPPTGRLRLIARKLDMGDKIQVTGAVMEKLKEEVVLNVEELRPLALLPQFKRRNPLCPHCGDRMKSKGKEEYRCPSCGYRLHNKRKLLVFGTEKQIELNKRYTTPPSAHRHLTLPEKRKRFSTLKREGALEVSFLRPFSGKKKIPVSKLISLKECNAKI